MDLSKTVVAVVGVLVAVILFAVVLSPVVDDYVDNRTTVEQNPYEDASMGDYSEVIFTSGTYEIKVSESDSNNLTVTSGDKTWETWSVDTATLNMSAGIVVSYTSGANAAIGTNTLTLDLGTGTMTSTIEGFESVTDNGFIAMICATMDTETVTYTPWPESGDWVNGGITGEPLKANAGETVYVFAFNPSSDYTLVGAYEWVVGETAPETTIYAANSSDTPTLNWGEKNADGTYTLAFHQAITVGSTSAEASFLAPIDYTVPDDSPSLMSIIPLMVLIAILVMAAGTIVYNARS